MTNGRRFGILGVAVAGAMALASTTASTQGRRGFPGGGPPGSMHLLGELDLTDDQREQVRDLFDEVERSGVPDRLREAREALHKSIESGADESTLRQQADNLGQVEGDAAVEFARVHSRIQEILTPEQRQELEKLKVQARERMEMHRRHREERREGRSKSGADLL
jgi:Spy/CpxP family protein refolding chaperone